MTIIDLTNQSRSDMPGAAALVIGTPEALSTTASRLAALGLAYTFRDAVLYSQSEIPPETP